MWELRKLAVTVALCGLGLCLAGPAAAASSDYNAIAVSPGAVYLGVGTVPIAQLRRGERLVVTRCTRRDDWCLVERVGIDGWVNSASLRPIGGGAVPSPHSRGHWTAKTPACAKAAGGKVCLTP